MPRAFTPRVVSANDLLEGDGIYMTSKGDWSRHHEDAQLFEDEQAANEALTKAQHQAGILVGAYLADAQLGANGKPEPVHFREVFRTRGPSNYPDHGKQAEL